MKVLDQTPIEKISIEKSYGTSNLASVSVLGAQVVNALGGKKVVDPATHHAILEMLKSMGPKTSHEGMLAVQMVSTHFLAMDCISRTRDPNSIEVVETLNKMTNRLMSLFLKQSEALRKLKNGGEQRIIIEKIEVKGGGQAVVGVVGGGGG